ncbi:2Fe-2S iron-sulfur cluster binding domain-containing protein [Streptomyces actuosus]|uniref:2Fe-2S iron-sulfur cluster binding domain-containing protein n=1 Tax=Streptomyces actuosus TaxID=1885 RepID=A0ABS2VZG6_STRAS|nr:2Fe-2S iron-sulfur cluster-binding protein [Streptomyces actuosus]MBN0048541.1 2Fe-2S iron-sulfur cluster binding domain-containing protein [Streptomyces actuosus]
MTMLQTHRGHWFRLRVSRVEALLEDTVALTLHVPPELATVFGAEPGRHVVVRHRPSGGGEVRRAYSVCPPPDAPDALRLVVRRHSPDGFGAYAGSRLSPGDEIELSRPTGQFGLPTPPGGHHVLIAGGTGITPLAAMAAGALRASSGCRVSLIHAVRTAGAALLSDELAALKDEFTDRLTVLYVLSRERRESELFTGRIDEARLRRLLTLVDARPDDGTTFCLCGPAGLVETLRTALTAWGTHPDRIRWELFSAGGAEPDGESADRAEPAGRVTAVIDGRSTVVVLEPGDRVVLDAVLRARPEVPYACRDGVCGSCRAKVVAGAVALGRQHALDDRDLARGYTLACRARPRTDELTLDFDA